MKPLKFLFLLSLLLGTVWFSGCEDDEIEPENQIEIRILDPTSNDVVADPTMVRIYVEVEATMENHEVEIKLHPTDDEDDRIIYIDLHEHDLLVTFEQTVDLSSYPSGQQFRLEVEACTDHDCLDKASREIVFSIP